MKNFVSLPGGRIINLENVAYVLPNQEGGVRVVFVATYSASSGGPGVAHGSRSMHVDLDKEDTKALLGHFFQNNVSVSAIKKMLGE